MKLYTRKTRRNGRPVFLGVAADSLDDACDRLGARDSSSVEASTDKTLRKIAGSRIGQIFWRLAGHAEDSTWHPSTVPVPERPLSGYEQKQREMYAEIDAAQKKIHHASQFHVNAGGMGSGVASIAPKAEADVHIVTLMSRLGAEIQIQWDESAGGFQIRTIRTERTEDRPVGSDAYVMVHPVASNVVLIVPTAHDHEESERRAARRKDL